MRLFNGYNDSGAVLKHHYNSCAVVFFGVIGATISFWAGYPRLIPEVDNDSMNCTVERRRAHLYYKMGSTSAKSPRSFAKTEHRIGS